VERKPHLAVDKAKIENTPPQKRVKAKRKQEWYCVWLFILKRFRCEDGQRIRYVRL
jgi:hypothetical protein